MREIEFRAKTLKDVRWIYGDLFKTGTDPSDEEWAIGYWDDESGWMNEQVQPDTIGTLLAIFVTLSTSGSAKFLAISPNLNTLYI